MEVNVYIVQVYLVSQLVCVKSVAFLYYPFFEGQRKKDSILAERAERHCFSTTTLVILFPFSLPS